MPDLNSYLRNYTKAPVMYMAAFDGKQQGWPTLSDTPIPTARSTATMRVSVEPAPR